MKSLRLAPILAIMCAARPGAAQGPTMTAWEFGVARLESEAYVLQMGYRASWVPPRGFGVDVAVATPPAAIMSFAIVAAVDLDGAYAIELDPHVTIVGRVGGTGVVVAGQRGGQSAASLVKGYNVGLGLVGRNSGPTGIRLDVVHRRFPDGASTYGITSVTVGIAVFR